jgi:drug/metabolite transporter (DMT)-like permease
MLFVALPGSTRGVAWMSLGSLCYACTYAVVRVLSESFDSFQIVFFRSSLGILVMLPWLLRCGLSVLRTERYGLYGARVGLNYVGMVCLMYGIANLTLQDVTALMFTETVGVARWCALVVGFAGAITIVRPGFVEVGLATFAVLCTSALYSLVNTASKSLTRTEDPNVIVFYVFLLMAVVGIGPALYGWTAPAWGDVPWIIALGVVSSLATVCLTRSFAAADASVVMPFNFLKLPFAVVIGMIWFTEQPDLWTVAGAAVIFSSTYFIARREARRTPGA